MVDNADFIEKLAELVNAEIAKAGGCEGCQGDIEVILHAAATCVRIKGRVDPEELKL